MIIKLVNSLSQRRNAAYKIIICAWAVGVALGLKEDCKCSMEDQGRGVLQSWIDRSRLEGKPSMFVFLASFFIFQLYVAVYVLF